MAKRLIVCCDGTWQSPENDSPTNIIKLVQALKDVGDDGLSQVIYYDEGLGADTNGVSHYLSGAFGLGLDKNILDAYRFLCLNYEVGDKICLFGFSRGAYTVRSLAGFIYACGLLERRWLTLSAEAYRLYRDRDIRPDTSTRAVYQQELSRKVVIDFMGCWDTVGALGIPDLLPYFPLDNLINKRYQFHDTKLSPIIRRARHAIALDETREVFNVTHMELSHKAQQAGVDLKEMWFAGHHGAVGGGKREVRGLADIALQWMLDEAANTGLGLNYANLPEPVEPDPACEFNSKLYQVFSLGSGFRRAFKGSRANLHTSVLERIKVVPTYRPKNIEALFKIEELESVD
jgi:uncharacterized protein (DUF2235 family)